MQLRAFLKPARMHAEPGYVSLSYDEKSSFHAKQIAGKFDEVAGLVLKVFGPVTFELVAPEGGRRVNLDGPGGGGGGRPVPVAEAAPLQTAPAPTRSQPQPAAPPLAQKVAAEIPAFEPTGRPRASRGPAFEPLERTTSAAQPERSQVRAVAAVLDSPAPLRPAPPPSPDDVAPAPLPQAGDAPWEGEHAVGPSAPADAQGGDRLSPLGAVRDLYIVEAISEEPDWGDIGGEVGGPPPPWKTRPLPTPCLCGLLRLPGRRLQPRCKRQRPAVPVISAPIPCTRRSRGGFRGGCGRSGRTGGCRRRQCPRGKGRRTRRRKGREELVAALARMAGNVNLLDSNA